MTMIYFFISILLYIFSPNTYSWGYCIVCFIVFILSASNRLMKEMKNDLFSFNLLFTISFFFVNFVYPIFVYPIDATFSLFRYDFNESIITQGTALALVAYTAYRYALNKFLPTYKTISNDDINHNIYLSKKFISILIILTLSVFCIFIIQGGLEYYSDMYSGDGSYSNGIIKYIITLLNPLLLLLCICAPYTNIFRMRFIYIFIISIMIILMFTGTRALSLSLGIVIAAQYIKRYRVGALSTLIIILIGIFVLSYVGAMRDGTEVDLSENKVWYEYGLDLIVNNRNLYVLYDEASKNGYSFGISMLAPLLQPIPFMQSFVSSMFNISPEIMKTSNITTSLEFGSDAQFGLGTNMVGDVYYAFGSVGVILFFYFLGYIIAVSRKNVDKKVISTVVYYILLSNAVFMCRASFFSMLTTIIWSIFLIKVLSPNKNLSIK